MGNIFDERVCLADAAHLTYAMLLVGYGSENGKDFWILKNKWSMDWGENGWFRLARNADNLCGVATHAL